MFPLSFSVQNYAWGRFGDDSIISKLKSESDSIFKTDASLPYAELWMGTHVSGPSRLLNGTTLLEILNKNPNFVGKVPEGYPIDDLPFLFKILSIRTALSIQSHPDKKLAAELFKSRPDIYKDSNHKPEMAIALTPFEALCGFRPVSEIKEHIIKYPELGDLLGPNILGDLSDISSQDEKYKHLKVFQYFFIRYIYIFE
jgi:mannose-6-phosphate isomerase